MGRRVRAGAVLAAIALAGLTACGAGGSQEPRETGARELRKSGKGAGLQQIGRFDFT